MSQQSETRYRLRQYQMTCELLDIAADSNSEGPTLIEAVCRLQRTILERAGELREQRRLALEWMDAAKLFEGALNKRIAGEAAPSPPRNRHICGVRCVWVDGWWTPVADNHEHTEMGDMRVVRFPGGGGWVQKRHSESVWTEEDLRSL